MKVIDSGLSIGYLDSASHLLNQVFLTPEIEFNELISLAKSDNIRLRGTYQIVLDNIMNFGWITIGRDKKLNLAEGLVDLFKEKDFKDIQRHLLWHYIKNVKPSWIRYLKHGIKGAKKTL